MEGKKQNLSGYNPEQVPNAANMRMGIVVSEWNPEITGSLLQGAKGTLIRHGMKPENILVHFVPGSFELPLGAAWLIEQTNSDAVICLGCVIQGETRHFEFICQAVSQGITNLGLNTKTPVIFGVLTPDTYEQARDRAGGKHGNKGDEAAITAIKMAALKSSLYD
ncbi:MAG TPA: 6,7-dimethyl-8-ribityllumazine synthase [Bacteroidales bacterium]|nr:6,7-dimethyl-8-ribityllumazine synthase [Bacteroidales bacterium]